MTRDTKLKVLSRDESQFNLEGILCELGSFGRYQLALLLLLAFRDSFLAMCNFNYVFTAAEVGHRCAVPECPTPYNNSWSAFTQYNGTEYCLRMAPLHSTANLTDTETYLTDRSTNLTDRSTAWLSERNSCPAEWFSKNKTRRCEKIVYDDYNSIVAEFDLGCEPWKRTLVGTVHNLGLVFSFVLFGFISDRYGRKSVIVGTPLVVGLTGLVKSFSNSYWMLLLLEFLETALGYGNASMVLSLEMVSHKRRVVFSCTSDILASLGSASFGLLAWLLPYWRHLMWAIYTPLLIVVFYIFLMDEGVRWLLAHNKKHEAVQVLNKVAKMNNITLSQKARAMMDSISAERKMEESTAPAPPPALLAALRSRAIVCRVCVTAACFACCTFVDTGCVIHSVSIAGNRHLNFSALVLLSIVARVVTALTLTRFGRKAPICVAYVLCAGFFIASAFVPKSLWWAPLALYVCGKMCSSYGLFSVWVVALEVFPTAARNSLSNLASTLGRLGSVLAPVTPLLEQYMSGLPSVVFGVVALGSAGLALLLPDTSRSALPEDVTAAENLPPVPDDETSHDEIPSVSEKASSQNELHPVSDKRITGNVEPVPEDEIDAKNHTAVKSEFKTQENQQPAILPATDGLVTGDEVSLVFTDKTTAASAPPESKNLTAAKNHEAVNEV